MPSDPTRISDPAVRALTREIAELTRKVETLERGSRTSQLGSSSIDDGTLWFTHNGVKRVSIGAQVDGKFGWGAVNGEAPPRPTPAILEASTGGVTIGWDGQFVGNPPSDFVHVKAHLSPVGASFIPSDGNCVGHLLGRAKLPVNPLDQTGYWCVLIAYNTSGVASEPSIVQGPVTPAAVVATEILDGIVTELALADGAVSRAKLAAGAVGTAQLGDQVVDLSKLADGSVDATKILDGSITPAKVTFTAADIGSIATYNQPTQPTGTPPSGSLWFDGAKLRRWSGAGWVELTDSGIANALTAAQQAQTDAANALSQAAGVEAALDGKVTVFYQTSPPSGANLGDLWIDTAQNNRLQRWSGTAWVLVDDQRIAAALANAATAQSTADGKIDAFYQGTAPSSGMSVGDLWYNTSSGNLPHRWNGTTWVPLPAGSGALADNAVTQTKIAGNAIVQGHITAGAIGTNQLAANSVVAGKIAADQIQSSHIVAGGIETVNLAADSVAAGKIAADAVTAREIQALSILADKIAANQIQSGHIEAGAITADKLEALLVLASQIIAGDPDDWHLELGDSNTPILYWDNENTGFAVSRDETTGQANVYMSGRVEFGNGSQIEQDYLDLCEQSSSGFQAPRPRQQRHWIDSGPKQTVTARWTAATQRGNLLLMPVFASSAPGHAVAPDLTTPAGWSLVRTVTSGTWRMSLFQMPNHGVSRAAETITANRDTRWAIGLFEYSGMMATALDVSASNSGTGTLATSGTTATTAQAAELHFAAFGSPAIGNTNGNNGQWTAPTNGFTKVLEGDGAAGVGIAVSTKVGNALAPVSTALTANKSVPWLGIVATFRSAAAAGVPNRPPPGVLRMYTRRIGGATTPFVIDDAARSYPVGRQPLCWARLNAEQVLAAGTNEWARTNWVSVKDDYEMLSLATSAATLSAITIPIDGYYWVDYRCNFGLSPSTGTIAAFITRNGAAPASRIAHDSRGFRAHGDTDGDATPVHALRLVSLLAGDVLYWGNFSNVGVRLFDYRRNIPTEMKVTYQGPLH